MPLKKRWTCMGFLFVLLPVTAYSQTGLYELPAGEMAVGLSLRRGQNSSGIAGSLGYGINIGVSFKDFDSGFSIGLNFH